jgi:hypothetical protein
MFLRTDALFMFLRTDDVRVTRFWIAAPHSRWRRGTYFAIRVFAAVATELELVSKQYLVY